MRELWGTFSVRDHRDERPFVADVLLYDRLIIPYPPDMVERERWEQPELNWDPGRQQRVLDVLRRHGEDDPLVFQIPWDEQRRESFDRTFHAAEAAGLEVDGYEWTAGQLLTDHEVKRAMAAADVRPRVVAAYVSRAAFENDARVEPFSVAESEDKQIGHERLSILVGRRFLVPETKAEPSEELDLDLLERAARLAAKASFKQKRSAYNDWVDRVIREGLTSKEAVARMNTLLAEYKLIAEEELGETRIEQAFLVAGTAMAVAGHFFPPLWVGNVVLAPVRYLIGREHRGAATPGSPAAMFHEARSELGLPTEAR
jgi:hypothetical protein